MQLQFPVFPQISLHRAYGAKSHRSFSIVFSLLEEARELLEAAVPSAGDAAQGQNTWLTCGGTAPTISPSRTEETISFLIQEGLYLGI